MDMEEIPNNHLHSRLSLSRISNVIYYSVILPLILAEIDCDNLELNEMAVDQNRLLCRYMLGFTRGRAVSKDISFQLFWRISIASRVCSEICTTSKELLRNFIIWKKRNTRT